MKCRTKTAKQKKAPPKGEKIMAKRVFIIVLDSFGIGEMPDAARFGDVGSNTPVSYTHLRMFWKRGFGYTTASLSSTR